MDIDLILASQSPRRRQLLGLLGYAYRSVAADADETAVSDRNPAIDAWKTAQLKTAVIAAQFPSALIIGADTNVALDGELLGKPVDAADARRMLRALRGRTHHVNSGVCILDARTGREVVDTHSAMVTMRDYSDAEIEAYIATGDPIDKAGAYAIQHPVFRPVAMMEGCYTGVMGLSICRLIQVLADFGLPVLAEKTAVSHSHDGYFCPVFEGMSETFS